MSSLSNTDLSDNYRRIEKAIRYIDDNFKEQPSIDEIAKSIGMSKYHFIRVFKEYAGVTPKEYREKGKDVRITYGYGESPFGESLIAFTSRGICYLGFIDNDKERVFERFGDIWENADLHRDDKKAREYLENIFIKNKKYDLVVKGTNFQINVWRALLNLPNGVVSTYGDIADYLDRPKAVRAVASAIANNHIGYLIPCHRVIAKSGAMSGYRWGIERKRILIAYESVNSREK